MSVLGLAMFDENGNEVPATRENGLKPELSEKELKHILEHLNDKYDVVTDGYKHDGGKPRLSLVPPILIRAVGTVMTHGAEKYGEGNWKNVEPERYRDALARHYCEYMEDPYGVDKQSGLPHLYHLACNVAFLLELEKEMKNEQGD